MSTMAALDWMVNEEMDRLAWAQSVTSLADESAPLRTQSHLPGKIRFLARGLPLPPGRAIALPPQVRAARGGFVYYVFGRKKGERRRKVLDVGMARTPENLTRRLTGKRDELRGKGFVQLSASVGTLLGVAPARDGKPDMKILHCHELLRQYRARNQLQKVGRYNPVNWTFDELEDLTELLRESMQ